jgi:subtilisin family serine protease
MIPWLTALALAEPPRTGHVLVRAEDPSILEGHPDVARVERRRGHVARVTPAPGRDEEALAETLRRLPGVRWAHPDVYVAIAPRALPDDPYVADQWHLANTGQQGFTPGVDIRAEDAWAITHGAGQLVAILDSGVDLDHPDLRVIDGYDYIGRDDSSDAEGDEAHGTACAGLAVGVGDNGVGTAGVAYEGEAYGIRLIGNSTLTDLYDAFTESVDAGATVLSNSWGFEDDCFGVSDYEVIADAFAYAEERGRGGLGAAVVFAAGNGNCDITANAMLAHETVVTVAAVNGFDVREGYSAFGPWVDIAAPSGGMYTTDIVGSAGYNGYPGDDDYTTWFNGTSASTPVVAGVMALMFASNERLTAADARDALCDSAVRIDLAGGAWDDTGWSPYYGCGRIDAGAAVRAVANLGPPPVPVGDPDPVRPEAAILAWTEDPDPDGDLVTWEVRIDGEILAVDRPWLDRTGTVDDGDTVPWQVRAVDRWGASAWSAEIITEITTPVVAAAPAPEPDGGCDHTGGAPLAALGAIAGLSRRIRSRP